MNLVASTISNNTATVNGSPVINRGGGGGVLEDGGDITLTSSTVANNTADVPSDAGTKSGGGGVLATGFINVFANNSTIVGNQAPGQHGGGIDETNTSTSNANAVLTDSIISANSASSGANCYDSKNFPATTHIVSGGHNIDSGPTCGLAAAGDHSNTDPRLGSLAVNGGTTQTEALLPGSPAIDAGDTAGAKCPASDQRGKPRPDNHESVCDIGAFEVQDAASASKPVLSGLKISANSASTSGRKVGGRCVKLTAKNAHEPHCKRTVNAKVSFSLNTAASVTFTFKLKTHGRKVKGGCVKQTRKNHKRPGCTRLKTVGSLTQSGRSGANSFPFTGKVGGRTLKPGTYQVIATPSSNGASGTPQTASLRVK